MRTATERLVSFAQAKNVSGAVVQVALAMDAAINDLSSSFRQAEAFPEAIRSALCGRHASPKLWITGRVLAALWVGTCRSQRTVRASMLDDMREWLLRKRETYRVPPRS